MHAPPRGSPIGVGDGIEGEYRIGVRYDEVVLSPGRYQAPQSRNSPLNQRVFVHQRFGLGAVLGG